MSKELSVKGHIFHSGIECHWMTTLSKGGWSTGSIDQEAGVQPASRSHFNFNYCSVIVPSMRLPLLL
jgi:hypothetical protein